MTQLFSHTISCTILRLFLRVIIINLTECVLLTNVCTAYSLARASIFLMYVNKLVIVPILCVWLLCFHICKRSRFSSNADVIKTRTSKYLHGHTKAEHTFPNSFFFLLFRRAGSLNICYLLPLRPLKDEHARWDRHMFRNLRKSFFVRRNG